MFFVDLPAGEMDAAERLNLVAAETRHFKESGQAVGAASLVGLTRWAPPTLHALAARLTVRQRFANLVVTNVPGQSGQPASPYYDNLLPLWASDTYFPLVFSRARVNDASAHTMRLNPR